jgi:hypothetical protein
MIARDLPDKEEPHVQDDMVMGLLSHPDGALSRSDRKRLHHAYEKFYQKNGEVHYETVSKLRGDHSYLFISSICLNIHYTYHSKYHPKSHGHHGR